MSDCTRCQTPLEKGDLRCAVCALPCPADDAPPPAAARARISRCTECGAAVAFIAEVQAPRCTFCGATTRVEEPIDPVEAAEVMLPFQVRRDEAKAALRGWLSAQGWLAPRDLASAASIDRVEPLCWAGWLINARALISWTADSDLGAQSSRWAPHAGTETMSFENILVYASRGLTADECARLTPRYDVATAGPITGDVPIEGFDVQRSAARKHVVRSIDATARYALAQGTIPGSRFRHIKVATKLDHLETRRVALPVWVLAYRYRGVAYRALVHGQDAAIVTGNAPRSVGKRIAIVVAVLAIIAGALALVAALGGR
jgi:hypothetical protein